MNDFEFSFYNDDVLLTGADDGLVSIVINNNIIVVDIVIV